MTNKISHDALSGVLRRKKLRSIRARHLMCIVFLPFIAGRFTATVLIAPAPVLSLPNKDHPITPITSKASITTQSQSQHDFFFFAGFSSIRSI